MIKNTINENEIIIDIYSANQRLDKFLLRQLSLSSKGFIYKMLRKKRIKLNGKKAEGNEILCCGDVLTYYISLETIDKLSQSKHTNNNAGSLDVIFEDNNIILCNKPAGVLTHSEKQGDNDTIVDRALKHVNANENIKCNEGFPVCVNRLDRNTTGIIIIAKNLPSAQWLSESLKNRMINKIYYTIVHGKIDKGMTINSRLQKNTSLNIAYPTESGGKESITEIIPLFFTDKYSLLSINLITGRTHQIRVHLSQIGHPIVGDKKYGGNFNTNNFNDNFNTDINSKKIQGMGYQLLHCYSVEFKRNDGYLGYLFDKSFICSPPTNFNLLIQNTSK